MKRFVCFVACLLLAAGVASADKTKVRWYVGLGGGSDAPTFKGQQEVVDQFNASQNDIQLVLEIVANAQAYDTLSTEIQAGNPPDIVGPVGIRGRDSFLGSWADMTPLIAKYKYDLKDFDSKIVKFFQVEKQGQLGLPFAIYPSVVFYNKDLFDEAKIAYPPHKYGQDYVDSSGKKKPWNTDTLREIAMQLTVDQNGKAATAKDFDPEHIVQFGYGEQMTDFRGTATLFGANSLVDKNGNAQIPQNWRDGMQWYYNAMWKDHFAPTFAYGQSDAFLQGNWFQTGNIAMAHVHLWYLGFAQLKFNWDVAAVPSYKGTATAKMHADTFELVKSSKNQDAAFKVLTYLIGEAAQKLCTTYGAMPARLSLQPTYFKTFNDAKFPGRKIDWQVFVDSIAYNDNPNHESWMPSFQETSNKYTEYWTKFQNDGTLNIGKELDSLTADLQKIFQAAKK
jgi:multiple sugar transport system substrate-binding protein